MEGSGAGAACIHPLAIMVYTLQHEVNDNSDVKTGKDISLSPRETLCNECYKDKQFGIATFLYHRVQVHTSANPKQPPKKRCFSCKKREKLLKMRHDSLFDSWCYFFMGRAHDAGVRYAPA